MNIFLNLPVSMKNQRFFHLPVEYLSNNFLKPDLREITSAFESCHRLLNSTQLISSNGILKSPMILTIATENPQNRSYLKNLDRLF